MAKGYESHLTIYKNDGWYGTGTSNPFVPTIESESIQAGRVKIERNSMIRTSRAHLPESVVNTGEYKPEGDLEILPIFQDMHGVFMSHFQIRNFLETGSSYIGTYVPLMYPPAYSGQNIFGEGTYGAVANDVYSIDIKRSFIPDSATGQYNVQHFQRGVCNTLTFKNASNDELKIKAGYKFKGVQFLNGTTFFGGTDIGSYTSGTFTDWRHGTWSFKMISGGGTTSYDNITSVEVNCSNNLLEKKTIGYLNRQFFSFGNYTVKGNIALEYVNDRFFDDWQDEGVYAQITGNFYQSDTNYLTLTMPYCLLKPFEKNLNNAQEFVDANVSFEAYEYGGASPITVVLHSGTQLAFDTVTYWDAAYGARTLAEYDFADAGYGARVLGEYDFADRDL